MDEQQFADTQAMGYLPRTNQEYQPLLDKHLDASDIVEKLKYMLLGKEYLSNQDKWVDVSYEVVASDGQVKIIKQGPLMHPKKITTIINYISMLLNSNTYLSKLDKEEINNMMWDIEKELLPLFFRLLRKKKLGSDMVALMWGMIDKPIYFGLKRASESAGGGMTINAATKMQHSIEHINPNQGNQKTDDKKKFNVLGW